MMKPLEPRTGEIYGPDTTVRFFLFKHALQGDRHVCEVPAGLSISEALDISIEDSGWRERYRHSFTIFLQDGTVVPAHMWDRVRLKPGTACVARPVAEGPFLAIIPMLLPTVLGPLFAGMGFFGQLLLTGITIGLKFLLNKLFAPKPVKPTPSDRKEIYSIIGSRNEITQWEPIPLVLGRHRITPPLCASPYTETVGDEQYLRQLFCNGYGALAIEASSIKIGETLVSTFPEATLEHRYGYSTDTATTLYPRDVLEQPFSIELLKNTRGTDGYPTATVTPWTEKKTATNTVSCGLDFSWPQGLGVISDEGQRSGREAIVYINWRTAASDVAPIAPAGAWSGNLVLRVVASTQKAVRRTFNITFPAAGQYDVRVHKESPETTKYWDDSNWTGLDMLMFTALRSFRLGVPLRFADAPLSVTAIRIRASGQLNQVVDSYNCVVQSKVVAFNGTSWVNDVASSNPADLFRHVLTCKANRRPYAVSQIDLVQLQKWWAYCVQQKWRYNKVIRSQMSVFDLIIEICAAGRAMPVFRDGKWSVVWDEQAVPISQLFTPRNSWNFEEQRDLEPIPHGYRMRFPSETKGWREDERVVYNDGYSKTNATLLEGFEMPGVTNIDSVWKHGRFHLAQRILRPGIFSLYAGWDALPLIRGDRVRVNHDSFRYGLYSGRVTAVDSAAQTVTIDTNVLLAGATNYMFRFRLTSGSFLERTIDPGYVGEYTKIGLVGTAMPMPAVGDLFSLGQSTLDSEVFRVIGIEPEDNMVHRLMLVADAPEIADADTGQIPDYTEGISVPIDPFMLPPRNVKVSDGVYADGGGVYWAYLSVTWEPPAFGHVTSFQLQYREGADDDDPWSSGGSFGPNVTFGEIRRLDSGVYTVRVRCIFDNGTYSTWAQAAAKSTTEYSLPPADVTDFRINITGDTAILRWQPVPGIGIIYELRWASESVPIPTWNAAIPLVTSVTDSATIATRTGTFFIKAKKPWGLSSLNARMISSLVGSFTQLNFVTNIVEHPTFAGVKQGVSVQDVDELRLTPDATNTYYPVTGTYYFANRIDLGEKISSRLSIILYAYGYNPGSSMAKWVALSQVNPLDQTDASEWGISSEFRISLVGAPYVWGPWQTFRLSDVQAWAMEFRLIMNGKLVADAGTDVIRSVTTPSIKLLTVQVDMQDRIEKGEDILSAVAGTTITFPRGRFRVVPAVVITGQGMLTGEYFTITNKTVSSFKVQFFLKDSTTGVARKFDWMAKGWGLVT